MHDVSVIFIANAACSLKL